MTGKRERNWFYGLLLAAGMSMLAALTASASGHVISSVTIRVSSGLEPGDEFPAIDYGSGTTASDGGIVVSVSGGKYDITGADWVTSTSGTIKVGDTPRMKVRLSPTDDYYFKGSYRSSNVTVKNGTFVKSSKSGDDLVVWLKVKAVKGDFEAPTDAYWKDNAKGTAKWEAADNNDTGKYEVVLRRGSSKVATVETTSRTYNFYPYMTVAGTYSFRVRTIARTDAESDYGKNSDWADSDEIYIAQEDVSDGSGRQDLGTGVVSSPGSVAGAGWIQSSGHWYYRYPDGSYKKDGWLLVGGKWYLFRSDGVMLTGWQFRDNYNYLLGNDGAMLTGWVQSGGRWYYFNPTPDAYQGCMFAGRMFSIDGKDYYFDSNGMMAEGWREVDGNWYYFYPGSGMKAVNTTVDTFYVDGNGIWVR